MLNLPSESILGTIFTSLSSNAAFTMCNPPFFSSDSSKTFRRKRKLEEGKRRKKTTTTLESTSNESISIGGEVGFVQRMIEESEKRFNAKQTRSLVYTSLLGCKSSLQPLLDDLSERNAFICYWMFKSGRTYRWIIAWSFEIDLLGLRMLQSESHVRGLRKPMHSRNWIRRKGFGETVEDVVQEVSSKLG